MYLNHGLYQAPKSSDHQDRAEMCGPDFRPHNISKIQDQTPLPLQK